MAIETPSRVQPHTPIEDALADDPTRSIGYWPRQKLEKELFQYYPEARQDLTPQVIEQYRRAQWARNNLDPANYEHMTKLDPYLPSPKPADAVRTVQQWERTLRKHYQRERQRKQELEDAARVPTPLTLLDRIGAAIKTAPEHAGTTPLKSLNALEHAAQDTRQLEHAIRQHYSALPEPILRATRYARQRLAQYLTDWHTHLQQEAGRTRQAEPAIEIEQVDQQTHTRTVELYTTLRDALEQIDAAYRQGNLAGIEEEVERFDWVSADEGFEEWESSSTSSSSSSSSSSSGDEEDLSETAQRILDVLDDEEWTSRQDLADRLDFAGRTITVRTTELEDHGLIEERTGQNNRKSYRKT